MEFRGWQVLERRMRSRGYADHEIAEAKRNYESAVIILGRTILRSRAQEASEQKNDKAVRASE